MGLDLEGKKEPGMSGSEESYSRSRTASAKGLRQEQAWHIEGICESVRLLVR